MQEKKLEIIANTNQGFFSETSLGVQIIHLLKKILALEGINVTGGYIHFVFSELSKKFLNKIDDEDF